LSTGRKMEIVWRAKTGEASELGRAWVQECLVADESVEVLLGGGEATVTVRGDGVGGRNTEFALAACLELDRLGVDKWVVASLATDGQDGTTGLATCRPANCLACSSDSLPSTAPLSCSNWSGSAAIIASMVCMFNPPVNSSVASFTVNEQNKINAIPIQLTCDTISAGKNE